MPKGKQEQPRLMWSLDLDNITSFIFGTETEDRVKSFIKETYEPSASGENLELKAKVITEGKNTNLNNEQQIKANLVRWMLDSMDDVVIPDGNFQMEDLQIETLSQKLALNALYQYGFIN